MRNFLSTARNALFMPGAQDRAVISEILIRLSEPRSHKGRSMEDTDENLDGNNLSHEE
jgi:hypothetical protein